MAFPNTRNDLEAMGYEFRSVGVCRGCLATIEWWVTPKGKNIPMDAQFQATIDGLREIVEAHFTSCPNAKEFRKK